jgi:hypothetical protein
MSDEVDEQTSEASRKRSRKKARACTPGETLPRPQGIRKRYYHPLSDTVIIMPGDTIVYDTIVRTMDVARNTGKTQLFPNVVISGKVG